MRTPRGFSLIELLVVIAIIGVLSAIVLASLTLARTRSQDAAVKANLHTVATQAEIFVGNNNARYNTDGTSGVTASPYTCPTTGNTMFNADVSVKSAIAAAVAQGSGGAARCYMPTNGSAFAVQVPLKGGGYWCVASTGVATYSTVLLSSASCP